MYNLNSDDEDDEEDDEGLTALEASLQGDDEVEEEWVDDEEDVFDEGNEYLEYLAQQASKTRPADRDDEDEESEYDELEEEIYYESPLDDLDPYIHFKDVFTGLQQHNPASYNELTKALTPEQQEFIMNLMTTAEQNVAKAAEAAAEAAKA